MPRSPFAAASFENLDAAIARLNDSQRLVVAHRDGPMVVYAGAGAGKTASMVARMGRLIADGVPPAEILGVTFTRKAADEMAERLGHLVGPARSRAMTLATFHSVGLKQLKAEPHAFGLRLPFDIADDGRVLKILREAWAIREPQIETILRSCEADGSAESLARVRRDTLSWIARFKGELLDPAAAGVEAGEREMEPGSDAAYFVAAALYGEYEALLQERNTVDMADLVYRPARAAAADPKLRARLARQWRYIMVDEYQDTQPAQRSWLIAMAEDHGNLVVVGDDDQTVHSWAGARPDYILSFDRDYPHARTVILAQNYRCTATIVEAGNRIIARNAERQGKALVAAGAHRDSDVPIRFVTAPDPESEADWIARDLRARPLAPGQSALILYRASGLSRAAEEALTRAGIAYRVVGRSAFWAREEVRDVVAWARVLNDPRDVDAALRVINKPARGFGDITLERLAQEIPARGLWEALGHIQLAPPAKAALPGILNAWRAWLDGGQNLSGFPAFLEEIGCIGHARSGDGGSTDRADSALEAGYVASLAGTLSAFVARAEGAHDVVREDARVILQTIHGVKGGQAHRVYALGWEDETFPTYFALNGPARDRAGDIPLEAERRLAYVAVTRAEQDLVITRALTRRGRFRNLSRFALDLPADRLLAFWAGEDTPEPTEEDPLEASIKQIEYAQVIADALGLKLDPDEGRLSVIGGFLDRHADLFLIRQADARHKTREKHPYAARSGDSEGAGAPSAPY